LILEKKYIGFANYLQYSNILAVLELRNCNLRIKGLGLKDLYIR
jgi:hypothetical protein